MLNQNKLETLNQANHLLNQKHARLGLKPMLVSGTSPEMFRAALERKLSERVIGANRIEREETQPRVMTVADDFNETVADLRDFQREISPSVQPATPVAKTQSSAGLWAWFLVLVVAGALTLVIYSYWASSLDEIKVSPTILASTAAKPLLITAGTYQKRSEANAMKSEIERITGDKVRVIKHGSHFVLQIGDKYQRSEDAYLVFDELVKYPLSDLAIRSI
jgi:hypothetical protein